MKKAMKLVVSIACAVLGAATALAVALPDGYTPLDYIQGDGTAALILTDYTPVPALDRVNAKFELTSTTANSTIFCSRGNNTTAQTHAVAAALLRTGIDYKTANKVFFRTKTRKRLALEADMLNNMEFYDGGRVVFLYVPMSLMELSEQAFLQLFK